MKRKLKEQKKWCRIRRQAVGLVLSAAMVLTTVPMDMIMASASEDLSEPLSDDGTVPAGYTENGSAGTDVDYYYYPDGSTDAAKTFSAGTLYIKGTSESSAMTSVSASAYPWYALNAKKVVVKDVLSITAGAFGSNASLEEVELSGVQSLATGVFKSSFNVKKIDLGQEITSWSSAITALPRLAYIKLPATVTSLPASAFKGCINLRDIAIYYEGDEDFAVSSISLTKANFYVKNLTGKAAEAIKTAFAGSEEGTLKEGYTLNSIEKYEQKEEKELEISAEEQYYLGNPPQPVIIKNTTGSEVKNFKYFSFNSRTSSITEKVSSTVESKAGSNDAYAMVEGNDTSFTTVSNMVKVNIVEGYAYTLQDGVLTLQAKEGVAGAGIPGDLGSNAPWYAQKDTITKVVVKNSVTSLGANLFSGYSGIQEVEFEEGSILKSIGANAFSGTGLTAVSLPDSVTTIAGSAFYNTGLTSVTLPDSLESLGDLAFGNTQITSFAIPEKVTGSISLGLAALTELTIKGNCQVKNFKNNTVLQKLVIGKNVETIQEEAFSGCTALTELTVEEENVLKSIGANAFYNTGIAGEISLPGTLESIGEKAFDSTSLQKITIGESDKDVSIGASAFPQTLTELEIKNTGTLRCGAAIVSEFATCEVVLYASDLTRLDGTQMNEGGDYTVSSQLPFGHNANITCKLTQEDAYNLLADLYKTVNPSPTFVLLVMGTQTTEDGLQYVVDYEQEIATITGYVGNATEIVIPAVLSGMPVTKIGTSAFQNSNVTKVTLPDSVTDIGRSAFDGCESLAEINLESVVSIGESAFAKASLSNITFSEKLISIGKTAFSDGLEGDIILPDSVQSIGEGAFYHCSTNEPCKIRLPENEAYTKIEKNTFAGVASNTVIIPSNITEIGEYAFYYSGYLRMKGVYVLQIESENLVTIPELSLSSYVCIANKESATYKTFQSAGYSVVGSKEEAKTELTTLLETAQKKLSESIKTDYQEKYLTVLETNINSAKAVLENAESQLGDYLAVASDITAAEKEYYAYPASASDELETLSNRVAEIEKQYVSDDYTEESWAVLLAAMDEANDYVEAKGVKYKSVAEGLLTKLNDAAKALAKKPTSDNNSTSNNPTQNNPQQNNNSGTGSNQNQNTNKNPVQSKKVKVKKVSIKKVLSKKKRSIKVTWKKLTGVTGYQICIGTNKKMTKNKKVITVKKAKTVTKTIKKLKSKKKYYVKVRAYKTVNGKKSCGAWSKVKKVKVK